MVLTGMYPSATMKTGKTTVLTSSQSSSTGGCYSLITVSRNASKTISHTLASVELQTVQPVNHIFVDSSIDDTPFNP